MNNARLDILISRAVDGEIAADEWLELEAAAATDPSVWRQYAQSQRDQLVLCSAVEAATAVADRIDLPSVHIARNNDESHSAFRFNRFGAWTGWAVAALVAIVATARLNQTATVPPIDSTHTAGIGAGAFQSASDAFQAYIDKGRESGQVVGEMPGRVLVETRPVATGSGYEVIFIRQVMERTIVPDLYQVNGRDEAGRPTLVRYQQNPGSAL
jgi:anti-sigma factor RsiW